jgi:predicted ATPase
MFILLLKLAVILNDEFITTTVFIEEPEQNAHPKLQSKLADLFLEVNKITGGRVRFVVETHSEYLIRRTQVLVAEADYKTEEYLNGLNPFKVYYFPEDGMPYDMKYTLSGRFENKFGGGFFDEAAESALAISRMEREKRNGGV